MSNDPNSPYKVLHDLWEVPTLPVTVMLPAYPLSTREYVNTTLWDAGQTIVVSLRPHAHLLVR